MKHTEKTEYLGKNLWDFPLNNSKYIFIQNIILAPFKSFDDNVLSLKKISEILKINTRYLFSGFDKSKKNNNSKYGKLSIPKNIIREKDMVSIISQEGIYSFTRQQLINLEEICSLYKDVKLLFGKDIQILANFKTIFEIYIIVNRDLILEFEYKNQKKIYNEDVIVRITNFNFDYFRYSIQCNLPTARIFQTFWYAHGINLRNGYGGKSFCNTGKYCKPCGCLRSSPEPD